MIIGLLISFNSCKNETDLQKQEFPKDLLTEAKTYFEENLASLENKQIFGGEKLDEFQKLNKKVLWDYAKLQSITIGESVRIPLSFSKDFYIRAGKDNRAISYKNLSYLMMYKDKGGKMHTEWVTAIPDDAYVDSEKNAGAKFSGVIIVRDWKGNIIKGYHITSTNEVEYLNSYSCYVDNNDKKIKTLSSIGPQCLMIPSWDCYGITGGVECSRIYQWVCFETENMPGGGGSGGGSISGGNGSPASPIDYVPPVISQEVINHLYNNDADCLFNHLTNNTTFKNLLASFQNNTNLNVTFQMGNPVDEKGNPVAGQTHHDLGTTNFTITINSPIFNQVYGIEAAGTFLHEAFHANLWVNAQQWFPYDLPSNFQNMSLVEQFNYIEARSGNGFINSNQHNYMASQINLIANALKDYTQTNYPDIYNNPDVTFDSYLAMAYRGLEGTQMYSDYVNSLAGKQSDYNTAYAKLVNQISINKCP
ncbi:MAG: hypothetical protein H7098_12600 [Oligoflexus sp.]|nr:hypothetical protein [Pseudopedobacter sp.]